MDSTAQVQALWSKLERNFDALAKTPIDTRGLGGRASGKRFILSELKTGRLYLLIEGRVNTPKRPPFIQKSDFEALVRFKNGEIDQAEARKSFRTSYTGPLVEKLSNFS